MAHSTRFDKTPYYKNQFSIPTEGILTNTEIFALVFSLGIIKRLLGKFENMKTPTKTLVTWLQTVTHAKSKKETLIKKKNFDILLNLEIGTERICRVLWYCSQCSVAVHGTSCRDL